MKKITTILSPLVLLATTALAQDSNCILQPSCSQLGYTSSETDCGTAKVLRCPFDVSQVACLSGGSSGNDGGSGAGGEPSDEFGTVDNSSCQVGYIYYSDDTCSPEYNYFKDPIGIVFDANRRYIIKLDYNSYAHKWSNSSSSAPIPSSTNQLSLARDLNGKEYTATLVSQGGFPAAEYCGNSTYGGKEWFLPSYGQWYLIHSQLATLYATSNKITVMYHNTFEELGNFTSTSYDCYWTSNPSSNSKAHCYVMHNKYFEQADKTATYSSSRTHKTICIAEY